MTCTPASLHLSVASRHRRVLPVRAWLQTGAAAAAIGFALTGAPTAGADDGTAARETSTDSAASTSTSRVSAGPAKSRTRQPVVTPKKPGQPEATPKSGIGKALFSSSGKVATSPQVYIGPRTGDVYLAIDDPALALWSKPQTSLRTDEATKLAFPEWLRGASYDANPDVWVRETLQGVRQQLDTSPFGVFTPAFPTVKNYTPSFTTTNGDGVSVTRHFGEIKRYEVRDQRWIYPPYPFGTNRGANPGPKAAYLGLLSAMATVTPQTTCTSSQPRCNSIVLYGGNDVVMPGWIGNAVIDAGEGDDIILASPQVNVAVYFGISADYPQQQTSRLYYPTPYALQGTASNINGNVFSGGAGSDVIYYDGSVAEAYGGTGDDILAPSFGSFNWAFDTLFQGTYTNPGAAWLAKNPIRADEPPLRVYQAFGDNWAKQGEVTLQGMAVISGSKALLGPDTDLRRGLDPNEFNSSTYALGRASGTVDRLNVGLVADTVNGNTKIDDATVNRLGGQKLYGGEGSDLIYGLDPDFYKGFKTAADGQGLRVPFNNPGADGKVDGRQYAQVFESVQMFGGTGKDYFALGNPGNLDPGRLDGNYLYRISGNSDSFKSKGAPDFGILEGDVFEVNLTYEGANWTSSVAGPGGAGGVVSATSVVKAGFDAIKVVNDLSKIAGLAFLGIPQFAAVASLGSFVAGIVPLFQPEAEKPITPESPFYRDPIGNWRKAIQIQDWDPADSITIHVDPSNSVGDSSRRWDQVQFGIINTTDTTNEGALTITAQVGGEAAPRPLISLERFTAKDGVAGTWWAWDFRQAGGKGAYVPITKDNLSFFGQVDPAKASVLVPYVDQYSFPVVQGTPLFRWTDDSLKNNEELLNTLRSNSERIVIQLDTMSLGYYWDIRYLGEASGPDTPINNLSVDQKASKLWVVNPDPGAAQRWIGYSLEDLAANPELTTKATPIWSLGNPNSTTT